MRFFEILILTILVTLSSQCARNETRSIGRIAGQDAIDGQFPYAVFLEVFYGDYFLECTGSFIGPEWIISSAKCVDGMVYSIVYLGSSQRCSGTVAYLIYPPEVTINPYWNVLTGFYDIALLRIPKTDICYNIFPVPLPDMNSWHVTYEGDTAIAAGWSGNSLKLQWLRVTVMAKQECATARGFPIDGFICVNSEPSQCFSGGLGAPLISENAGILIGIKSYSFHYNEVCIMVYTRVTYYLTWIQGVTSISY